jgi:D-alanyl-D-alanine carboxypeptidase (penicillin-binding protein 5/6)
MFVPLGGKVSIDDLLQGMLVQSGNDACIVLAQGLAGSQAAFVRLMNEKAKEIGLTNSHFDDVDGLPDPDHWVTARDLVTLALATIRNFPEYYHYYSQQSFTFDNIKQGNRNPLLYDDIGADGLKTGHTDESGYSLVGSIVHGKRRIILVLSGLPSKRARAQEGKRLALWALREWGDYRLFTAGADVEDAPVWLGARSTVALTLTHDLVVTLPRQARKDMKVTIDYRSPVPAPVEKGQAIGTLIVTAPGMTPHTVPLVAATSVGRLGPIGRVAALAGYFVWGNR